MSLFFFFSNFLRPEKNLELDWKEILKSKNKRKFQNQEHGLQGKFNNQQNRNKRKFEYQEETDQQRIFKKIKKENLTKKIKTTLFDLDLENGKTLKKQKKNSEYHFDETYLKRKRKNEFDEIENDLQKKRRTFN